MSADLILALCAWSAIWAAICAIIAQGKNRDAIDFAIYGAVLGPLGLLVTLFAPAGDPPQFRGKLPCPACDRLVPADSNFCPNCGVEFAQPEERHG